MLELNPDLKDKPDYINIGQEIRVKEGSNFKQVSNMIADSLEYKSQADMYYGSLFGDWIMSFFIKDYSKSSFEFDKEKHNLIKEIST